MLNGKLFKQQKKNSRRPETSVLESETVSPEVSVVRRGFNAKDFISSLLHRNYRYFWIGALLSNIGTWLQMVALGWLVLQLTDSAFYLGLTNFASLAPVFFFALFAGLAADRYDRRQLLIITQIIMMFFAFILGLLSSVEVISVPLVLIIVFISGIALAYNFPAWQAIVPDLVSKDDLLNAIALNSAQFNAARLIGPAIAGLILAKWGAVSCFYLNALSFIAVIIALYLIHPAPNPKIKKDSNQTFLKYSLSGIKYSYEHRLVGVLLISVGFISTCATPYTTLMPIYAKHILKVGASGYGFLLAASGLGAVLGGLLIAPLSHIFKKQALIKSGLMVLSISLSAFAFSRIFIISLFTLAVAGGSLLAVLSTMNTSLQMTVPNEIRGRIMSLYVLMFLGMMPFGSLIFGALAQIIGSPAAIFIGAVGCLLLDLLLIVRKDLILKVDSPENN